MATIVNGVVSSTLGTLSTQLSTLPQTFSFAGGPLVVSQVTAVTGSFVGCIAATGTFGSLNAAAIYNTSGTLLTQTQAAYCGSLASTGAGTLVYTPVVNRGVSVGTTGTFTNTWTLPASTWSRVSYTVNVSTVPAASAVQAACVVGGTTNASSVSSFSNKAPTASIGTATAVAQSCTLVGFCDVVPNNSSTLALTLTCSTGTCVVAGGSIQVLQLM